jgi:hypothetical protein
VDKSIAMTPDAALRSIGELSDAAFEIRS